jgi:hypothetical protein
LIGTDRRKEMQVLVIWNTAEGEQVVVFDFTEEKADLGKHLVKLIEEEIPFEVRYNS